VALTLEFCRHSLDLIFLGALLQKVHETRGLLAVAQAQERGEETSCREKGEPAGAEGSAAVAEAAVWTPPEPVVLAPAEHPDMPAVANSTAATRGCRLQPRIVREMQPTEWPATAPELSGNAHGYVKSLTLNGLKTGILSRVTNHRIVRGLPVATT